MARSLLVREEGALTIRVDETGDSLVVRAIGELDLETSPVLEESVRFALERDSSPVLLDLSRVNFADPGSVRAVLWAAEREGEAPDRVQLRLG